MGGGDVNTVYWNHTEITLMKPQVMHKTGPIMDGGGVDEAPLFSGHL